LKFLCMKYTGLLLLSVESRTVREIVLAPESPDGDDLPMSGFAAPLLPSGSAGERCLEEFWARRR